MLFNSIEFLVFFPTVLFLYFLLPHAYRWILLLVASYTFYMFWSVGYALLLVASTLIDYICSRMMGHYQEAERPKRSPWLWLSLFSNLGILVLFKYFNFFSEAAASVAALLDMRYATPVFQLLLPMGISFYTFQTMSYTIDVYYDRIKPEKHLGIFALFVTFFPQLVAGPIERAGNLLQQLKTHHEFDYERVSNGIKRMGWGFFKKVVIADRLAVMVNQVYNSPTDYEGIPLLIATVFFAFQIYCDFSGYSDIAIGCAQAMGFRLMENFRSPYFSRSIPEFWKRWHISLSTWFKDYLYIPLGGNRVVKWRWYYNLFIVFLVSGLWHGANWTFLLWGALHGFYQIAGHLSHRQRNALVSWLRLNKFPTFYNILQVLSTFSLVCFAWIFFRANSLADAFYISTHIFTGFTDSLVHIMESPHSRWSLLYLNQMQEIFFIATFTVMLLVLVEHFEHLASVKRFYSRLPSTFKIAFYGFSGAMIFLLGNFSNAEFIYFQF